MIQGWGWGGNDWPGYFYRSLNWFFQQSHFETIDGNCLTQIDQEAI